MTRPAPIDLPSAAGPAEAPARSLSPSRAGDFITCPLLYRFRTVDRLPERPSPEAVRGTVVHTVLERLFDLPRGERTLARASALLEPAWSDLLAAEPELSVLFSADETAWQRVLAGEDPPTPDESLVEPWLASARGLLEAYFGLEDPTRLEPAERELEVSVVLDSGLVLRGFVDRLDVTPQGDMRVVDYKTGRSPREAFEQKALFQMRFYALVLWRLRGRVPRLLQLLYLGDGTVLRYEPDEADLRATERKLEALRAAIDRAHETGDWRANPSRLCDWCSHRAICPAWGGTPPPLPARSSAVGSPPEPVDAPEVATGMLG